MQTLAILGMPWVGSLHREDLPVDANPKGYFEDHRLLGEGITAEHIARFGPLDGCALKLSLSHMLLPDRLEQWKALESAGAKLLIPFRHPLESAASLSCFDPRMKNPRDFFFETTRFLYNYPNEYRMLAALLTRTASGLSPRTALIPYSLHIDDPQGYVEEVRTRAGIEFDPARSEQAVGNIEQALYRIRVNAMPDEHRRWCAQTPAQRVYEILCADPQPWKKLLE